MERQDYKLVIRWSVLSGWKIYPYQMALISL